MAVPRAVSGKNEWMQITLYTDYSIRVLMYLGIERDRLVTINELAEAYDISRNHLVKVVHHLARAGYIWTVRGKGGGMRLGRSPAAINIGALVRRTEKDLEVIDCAGMECRLLPHCRLRGAFQEARNAFVDVLDGYTLADLIENGDAVLEGLPGAVGSASRGAALSVG